MTDFEKMAWEMTFKLTLDPSDEVVTALVYDDKVYIFTRFGKVFQMTVSWDDQLPLFRLIQQ